MTLQEMRGDLSSLKIVFVGEGANISNSWFMAAAKLDGLRNADVILTDGWPSKEEGTEEFAKFLPYQLTIEKLQLADKDCLINPCPPFTRGQEVTEEVIASKHFVGYAAKENLLHMQKAILTSLG